MHLDKISDLSSISDHSKLPQNCLNFINTGKHFYQDNLLNDHLRYVFIVPDSRFFSILFSLGYFIADYSQKIKKNNSKELSLNFVNGENFKEIKGKNFAIIESGQITKTGYAFDIQELNGEIFLVLSSTNNAQKFFVNEKMLKNNNQKIYYYNQEISENITASKTLNKHNRNLLSLCLDDDSILDKEFLKNEQNSRVMYFGNLTKFNQLIQIGHYFKNQPNEFKFSDIIKLRNNNNLFFNSYFKTNRSSESEGEPELIIYTDSSSLINNEFIEDYNQKPKIIFLSPNNRNYFEAIDKVNNNLVENKIYKEFDINKFRFQYPFVAFEEL